MSEYMHEQVKVSFYFREYYSANSILIVLCFFGSGELKEKPSMMRSAANMVSADSEALKIMTVLVSK